VIEFGRFAADRRAQRGLGKPETFNFLGFTFICERNDQGKFFILRKTRRDRMQAKLRAVKEELRRRMHQPIPEQGEWLCQVVRGFFAYHAVPSNLAALNAFRHHVERIWLRTLRRRSQKHHLTWERMRRLASDWLPKPQILHPWPDQRFAVRHPRWKPYARIGPVRLCAGGDQQ
jgi:RNA-directed DNA polymerase